jgi:hypothetical protein
MDGDMIEQAIYRGGGRHPLRVGECSDDILRAHGHERNYPGPIHRNRPGISRCVTPVKRIEIVELTWTLSALCERLKKRDAVRS